MTPEPPIVSLQGVSKLFPIFDRPHQRILHALRRGRDDALPAFAALQDVSFDIQRGESVGVIGRNGSGKSTLLQIICGTQNPTSGSVQVRGRIGALLELGAGFNPEFTGRENAVLSCTLNGMSRSAAYEHLEEIAAFADIGDYFDRPVKTYSSGMYARLAFAVNTAQEPEIFIVDEALAVGDMFFQAKCIRMLKRFMDDGGTLLFVSHDMTTVERLCPRALLLVKGRLAADAPSSDAANQYYLLGREENQALPAPSKGAAPLPQITPVDLRRQHMSGDGAAEILGAEITNDAGAPTANFLVGQALNVRLHVRFHRDLDQFHIGVGLRDWAGQLVGGIHTFHNRIGPSRALAGEVRAYHARIQLDLAPAEYLLLLGIASNESAAIWREHCVLFDCYLISVASDPPFWGIAKLNASLTEQTLE